MEYQQLHRRSVTVLHVAGGHLIIFPRSVFPRFSLAGRGVAGEALPQSRVLPRNKNKCRGRVEGADCRLASDLVRLIFTPYIPGVGFQCVYWPWDALWVPSESRAGPFWENY